MPTDKFSLGDIVCFKSHPYLNATQKILISGEALLHPPLMVINECLKELKTLYDEKSGDEVNVQGDYQCKCLWYSSRTNQFEEHWISSKALKHIKFEPDQNRFNNKEEVKNEYQGKLVILKTAEIELGKQKSSISIESSSLTLAKDKNTINPLLAFVPPVMQVIQIIENKISEQKEPLYDSKSGEQKRFLPRWLLKCRWYNPNEKISERLIPIECIELLPVIESNKLEAISDHIDSGGYYEYNNSLIQPKNLLCVNGIYYLKAFDYLFNSNVDLKIMPSSKFVVKSSIIISTAPIFEFASGETLPKDYFSSQIINEVNSKIAKKYYLRIQYTNRLDVTSYRTIKDYEVIIVKEGEHEIGYLKAFCLLKNSVRYFRISRINELQVLDLTYS